MDALHRYRESLGRKLTQDIEDRILWRLATVLRHPTGHYESRIHTERQINDLVVTDTPVVYGPWLEGVGSRNFPVTRFRGYHTFRFVFRMFEHEVEPLAEAELQPYLSEMN